MNVKPARRITLAMRKMLRPALLASASAAIIAGMISSTPAHAAELTPTGCASPYVVQSVPLINESTGVASYNYGYVQLWYSNSCQKNWTRVVFKLQNFSQIRADIYAGPGVSFNCGSNILTEEGCFVNSSTVNGATAVESPGILSPNNPAAMCGGIWTDSGTMYAATWAQPNFPYQLNATTCA
jgi:hypothetical protein